MIDIIGDDFSAPRRLALSSFLAYMWKGGEGALFGIPSIV